MKVWKNPYVKRFGEDPLTIVKDLNTTLKVELIEKPNITGALEEFVTCGAMSQAPNIADSKDALQNLINSNSLWQGLETLHFTFRVTGCSRMLTHQLVRHRVGITFSQQCSDSVDWRHQNIVLPNVLPYWMTSHLLNLKVMYANMVDSMEISCQEARYILPQCLETFIYIHVSLATLIPMVKKRICTMSQPWETVMWARQTQVAVLKAFPELVKAFIPNDCTKKMCFYHKSKKHPTSAYLYPPLEEHATPVGYHPDSYVYTKSHHEMANSKPPHKITYYLATDVITEKEYNIEAKKVGICQ